MTLTTSTLNKAFERDTFAELAASVAERLPFVTAARITGEQRLNSLVDEITVDTFAAHYKAAAGDSLPAVANLDNDRINSTVDTYTLAHAVAYVKSKDIPSAVPVNSVAPVIDGAGNGPFTVTDNGTWSNNPDSYNYQWYRGSDAVAGATTDTLEADALNVGQSITCEVAGVNAAGAGSPVSSNAIVGA